MRKSAVLLAVFALFFATMFVSCANELDKKMKWIDVLQTDVTIFYDNMNKITKTQKKVNEEAGYIFFVFYPYTPENREIELDYDHKYISAKYVTHEVVDGIKYNCSPRIEVTPLSPGKTTLVVKAKDTRYGCDAVNITVVNYTE